mmetsp:Transcript_106675/g.183985  ORF Transcript_106675/g.183985 Transcript_106675/m.183985 type:complete len:96 (+) Transcript_106675:1009-1296(+)
MLCLCTLTHPHFAFHHASIPVMHKGDAAYAPHTEPQWMGLLLLASKWFTMDEVVTSAESKDSCGGTSPCAGTYSRSLPLRTLARLTKPLSIAPQQ